MNRKLWLSGLMVLMLLFSSTLAACGDDDESGDSVTTVENTTQAIESNAANGDVKIVVGSKNFTEQKILGEIFAQGLAAAGYDIPTDPQAAFEEARKGFAKEGLTALPPTPFTNSNEVALTADKAEELGVEKISDLQGKSEDLTLYGSPECRQRQDCLLGLQETYDLQFKEFVPVDVALRHEVLEKGQADLSIVFTTDPQNSRDKLVLLEDDKEMFPPYNSTLVVRDETIEAAGPDLEKVAAQVEKGLTGAVMSELNARVDLDKKTPKEVATEYLQESGLIE